MPSVIPGRNVEKRCAVEECMDSYSLKQNGRKKEQSYSLDHGAFDCDLKNQKSSQIRQRQKGRRDFKSKETLDVKSNFEIILGMGDIKHLIDRRGIQCRSHVNSVADI